MNTQRLRTVPAPPAEPSAPTPAVPVLPVMGTAASASVVLPAPDTSQQQTSVMRFDDLEEFRQAARARLNLDLEEERVTPTGHWVSPFANVPEPAAPLEIPPIENAARPVITPEPLASPSVAPQVSAPKTNESPIARSFREASWPKRATVLLLPVVIGLYGLKAFRHTTAVKRTAARTHAVSSASASAAAPGGSAVPDVDAVPASSANLPAPSATEARNAGPTLQRRAVDAHVSGNYQDAASLYRRLATQFPDRPEFAVAGQIAAEKAKAGQHE